MSDTGNWQPLPPYLNSDLLLELRAWSENWALLLQKTYVYSLYLMT